MPKARGVNWLPIKATKTVLLSARPGTFVKRIRGDVSSTSFITRLLISGATPGILTLCFSVRTHSFSAFGISVNRVGISVNRVGISVNRVGISVNRVRAHIPVSLTLDFNTVN